MFDVLMLVGHHWLSSGATRGAYAMTEQFSDRQGYRPVAAPIMVREDAPSKLRGAIPLIARGAGMMPSAMR